MKHLGDITKISGYGAPIVDVITGGSPCQDLSVAGKRAGLAGERSGLFMEQIRIIKEMRSRNVPAAAGSDRLARYPRYCIWENVPGAFSSNGGKDFQAVLTEFTRVCAPDAPDVPLPDKGRWSKSGCVMGVGADGQPFSVCWRLHDAQYWGVPQRRKRIAVVCDFGGLSAPEILFERKGMSGDPEPRGEARETAAGATGGGAESTSIGFTNRGYDTGDVTETLRSDPHGAYPCVGVDVYNQEITGEVAASLTAAVGGTNTSGAKVMAYGIDQQGGKGGANFARNVCPAILSDSHGTPHAVCYDAFQYHGYRESDTCGTLSVEQHKNRGDTPLVCEDGLRASTYQTVAGTLNPGAHPGSYNGQDAYNDMLVASANGFGGYSAGCGTLRAAGGDHGGGSEMLAMNDSSVRRLTPLECERLQGFPDGWTDIGEWTDSKGKKHKDADSPRYKALGNSIAVGYANNQSGFWCWLARRICAQYERRVTMASLFDGIGGFPLAFSACGAIPVWASEIEEFPIAVTKIHFPEDE